MNRITEQEIFKPAMKIVASNPNGVSTSRLINEVMRKMNPKGEDMRILKNRGDVKFTQKVRNLISHRNNATSIIRRGYLRYEAGRPSGKLFITQKGQAYLNNNP